MGRCFIPHLCTLLHVKLQLYITPTTPLVSVHLISVTDLSADLLPCLPCSDFSILLGSIGVTCFLVCSMGPEYMYLVLVIYPITVHVSCSKPVICSNYYLYCLFVVVQLLWYTMGWQWHCCIKWCEDTLSIYKLSRKLQKRLQAMVRNFVNNFFF